MHRKKWMQIIFFIGTTSHEIEEICHVSRKKGYCFSIYASERIWSPILRKWPVIWRVNKGLRETMITMANLPVIFHFFYSFLKKNRKYQRRYRCGGKAGTGSLKWFLIEFRNPLIIQLHDMSVWCSYVFLKKIISSVFLFLFVCF